jgi:hypothetical protein
MDGPPGARRWWPDRESCKHNAPAGSRLSEGGPSLRGRYSEPAEDIGTFLSAAHTRTSAIILISIASGAW